MRVTGRIRMAVEREVEETMTTPFGPASSNLPARGAAFPVSDILQGAVSTTADVIALTLADTIK